MSNLTQPKTPTPLIPESAQAFGHSPYQILLEKLGKSCGVEIDPIVALDCIRRVERDLPGTWETVWVERVVEAGRDLGLRISARRAPMEEAIRRARPDLAVATLAFPEQGEAIPMILIEKRGRRVNVQGIHPGQPPQSLPVTELRKLLQPETNGEPVSTYWITADPLIPCQPLNQQEQEEHHEHHGPSPWSRLVSILRHDRKDLWVIFLFSLGVGIFSLSTPIAVEALVNTVQGGTRILLQPVIALSIVLFGLLAIAAFLRVMKAFVVEYLQQRIFVRVTADLAWRLPRVRVESLDRHHGPDLVNRFFDVLTVQKASAVLLTDGLAVALQTVIGMLVLAFYNPYLLGFDFLLLCAIGFVIFILGRGGVRTSIQESYSKYHVAGWLEEMVRHPLAFRTNGGPELALERADQLARRYVQARRSHFRIVFRQVLFTLGLQAVASAALLGLGGWLVINRGLTLGQLVAAELIITIIVGSFVKFGKSLESYYDLMAGLDKLGHLIDLPLESIRGEGHRPTDAAQPALLRAQGLVYQHPDEARRILDGFSCEVEPGERVALVGPHGSGKSTLVDIIYGLREPQAGFVTLDGVDYREIRHEALRGHVATAKGLEVLEGTVIDNVRMGRHNVSLSDVREALRRVHLLDEVQVLSDGLHTHLSTGGNPLSIGQARRLMLARAIAGHPRLLLIDEGLDYLHEDVRQHVIEELLEKEVPWTCIITTHSSEIAQRCDRVIQLPGSTSAPSPDYRTDVKPQDNGA